MKETVFSTLSGILMRKVDKQSFFQEEKVVTIIIFEFFTIKLRRGHSTTNIQCSITLL